MNLLVAILLALPASGKIETPWAGIYKGINPKGGSDAYGYTYRSSQDGDPITFNWIEISGTGTNLNLSDDDSATVNLPFVFKLYDDTTSSVHVQSNGGITFRGDIQLSYSNHALPDTNGTMIAVYWSDQNPASHGGVYYQFFGDTMAVIEWYQVPEYNGSSYNTYEIVLYSDGRIKLQYFTIGDYSDETVGIQSKDAYSTGNGWYIQYVYNSNPASHVPGDSTVIEFQPPIPQDHDIGILSLITSPTAYLNDTITITATVKNHGLNSETFDLRFIIDTNSVVIFDTIVTSVSIDTAQVKDVSINYIVESSGNYNVTAYTILATDTNYINDTAYTHFLAINSIPLPYITDFEQDSGYFYHTGQKDPWQWGAASHVHSGTYGWATTLTDTYPSNGDGTLYTYAIDLSRFSPYDSTYVTFWYFDSLESGYDYVYLLITEDRGLSWDTLKAYTGYADDWSQEYVDLKPYNGKKVQLAFKFSSDYSVTKAGFFMDDFKVGIPLDNDVGIRKIQITPLVSRPNDTVEINIFVHNFGLLTQNNFYTGYMIKGSSGETLLVDSSLISTLPASSDTQISIYFSPQDTGTFTVIAYTQLSIDEYTGNDTLQTDFLSGGPDFTLDKYTIGGDGIADPGENNVPLIVNIVNNGARADSTMLNLSTSNSSITITNPSHYIGEVLCGDTIIDTFLINVSSSVQNGDVADFILNITAENNYQSTQNFQIILGGKAWTVMVFINGDNNLTSYGVSDIDEMESVGSNDYMNILVQFDGYSSYTDSAGTHQDANRYYITQHPTANDMIDAYPIMNLGEVDMGDTNVIFDFFKWGVDNYPARHYLFVIWDHGSGWVKNTEGQKGVSHDDTDNDYLSFANGEARALLKKMHDYLGRNIDILGYDVCVTQMLENLYEVYGYADHVVASEKSEPGDGWDYHFLQAIATNPDITPQELSSEIVNYYSQYYASQNSVTLSAVRLNKDMQTLFGLINNLSRELIKAGGIGRTDVHNIINNLDGEVETGDPYGYFVDVKHFAMALKNAGISTTITAICDSIIALYDSGSLFNNAWASSDVSSSMYGISVMLPPAGEDLSGWEAPYSGLLISNQTLWYRFLMGDTILPDTPHTTLNRAFFEIQGIETDTLAANSQGTLHLVLSNYTRKPDSNVTLILNAPQFMTFDAETINISVVPEDSTIEVEIPFTVAQNATNAGYSLGITINSTNYTDSYRVPFIIGAFSDVKERNAYVSTELRTGTFIKPGATLPIQLSITQPEKVNISLFDIQGRKVKTLFTGRLQKGIHSIHVTLPSTISEGIYFVVLDTPENTNSHRVILIK